MTTIKRIFKKRYPQNYILRKPLQGSLIFLIFCFVFIMIYRPVGTHEGRFFSYTFTMAAYCIIFSLFIFVFIRVLKKVKYFSDPAKWTFLKESTAIIFILSVMGITVFAAGFFMEAPAERWNLGTFFNSFFNSVLIGFVPFAVFSIMNSRHLVVEDVMQELEPFQKQKSPGQPEESPIRIGSRLKKEELSFYPAEFIYAESDGNYVVFHLMDGQKERKAVIRNSISNIEQQLEKFPHFFRTHRAYIVNLKMVHSKNGNTLGYQLKLMGTGKEIPVSRQNVQEFDRMIKQHLLPSVTKNYIL